jgi:hypothetical protein
MKVLTQALRLVVLVCLAALLIAALPQAAVGLALALLVPEWFFFASVISAALPVVEDTCDIRPFPALPVFFPRPPPII